ncbi:MAG: hypothetical protein JO013_06695 [Alphaproteobacteria bacterium]|nr:hypothetical protein [Alphaproteobacteria bacterium]
MILSPAAALLLLQATAAPPAPVVPAPVPAPVPAAAPTTAPAAPQLVVAVPAAPADRPGAIVVPKQTLVRLMVLNEVNSREAKPGTRFVLRVDENVVVGGATVIPVGARAWGEVTAVTQNKALGKPGSVGARLLWVEAKGERVALVGEEQSRGAGGGDKVAMAWSGFGPFALFTKGNIGKLKAGFIFNGYLAADRLFDPATGSFLPADPPPAAAPATP